MACEVFPPKFPWFVLWHKASMFSCNVDRIRNFLPGVAFGDEAADWKAAPIGGFNMPPEHSA